MTAPVTDAKTDALFLLKAKVVRDWLVKEETAARARIIAATDAGDRVTATVEIDGKRVKVGGVTAKMPTPASKKAVVTDERALLAWCLEHAPHTVVQTVRSTDLGVLLKEAETFGGHFDATDGTVTVISGVEVRDVPAGERGVMVTAEKDVASLFAAAYGSLTVALPAGAS